ncbi:MAG: hypothetical protein EBS18_01460, partial [Actinobacteria bacterium]|nr:hypothetical protein [Actinomycetota bacterium]
MLRAPKFFKKILPLLLLASIFSNFANPASAVEAKLTSFQAEVWADNWFALYSGMSLVGEDSVPITTERSFNAEVIFFDAELPLTLNLV